MSDVGGTSDKSQIYPLYSEEILLSRHYSIVGNILHLTGYRESILKPVCCPTISKSWETFLWRVPPGPPDRKSIYTKEQKGELSNHKCVLLVCFNVSHISVTVIFFPVSILVWFCIPSICICYATSERETKSEEPATQDMKPTTNYVETVSITNSIFSNIRTWCDGYRRGFENILLRKKLKFNLLTGWAFSDGSGLKVSMFTFSMILTNIICNHMTIKCIS